jgi:hypothetical protein
MTGQSNISPISLMAFFAVIVVILAFGYMAFVQWQFQATAEEICEQIVDKNDTQTTSVRNGNYINDVTRYHGYDVCRARNGTVVSNTSLGYGTELEIMLGGL